MRVLVLCLMLLVAGCASWPPVHDRVHKATLTLRMGNSGCSGTAVGRYTILSASHCFEADTRTIVVNGKSCAVWKIINDGNDHALLTVGGCEFRTIARMAFKPGAWPSA